MKHMKKLAAGILLFSQALSGAVYAAPVTLVGTNIDFTFDNSLLGLFGQPTVSGNTLFFTPVYFSATSVNGEGYVLTNDTLNVKISAHQGATFNSLNLTERGDYLLLGNGSTADISGQLRAFDTALPLVDLTASIMSTTSLNLTGVPTKNWVANASLNLATLSQAKTLNVTLENLLLTSTNTANSLAFAQKKFVGLSLTTGGAVTPVPEAETYSMMLAGLGLVGLMVARRTRV